MYFENEILFLSNFLVVPSFYKLQEYYFVHYYKNVTLTCLILVNLVLQDLPNLYHFSTSLLPW